MSHTCRPSNILGYLSVQPVRQEWIKPQHVDLLERYRGLITVERIKYDEEQIRVIMQLRRLQKTLDGYSPPVIPSHYVKINVTQATEPDAQWWDPAGATQSTPDLRALIRIKSHAEEIAALTTPKGILLTGPPGTGKSFLIDVWYSARPTPFKGRKHYSELVLKIYRAVWEETRHRMRAARLIEVPGTPASSVTWSTTLRDRWKELMRSGNLPERWHRASNNRTRAPAPDPIIAFVVAQRLLLRHWLLVFDEVQLLDVSSATLLADVLSWCWRVGGVIVGTSNKVPDDLYKNGVQRDRLEPFVKGQMSFIIWFVYSQGKQFNGKLAALSGNELITDSQPQIVTVFGRSLHVPWSADGTCKFTFAELCDESLGPADYMTIASTFHTVAITSIPILKLAAKNQARRFISIISLIDALYEARCRLVCLSEAHPEELFFPDAPPATTPSGQRVQDVDVMMVEALAESQDVYRPNVSSYDAPNMAEAPSAPSPLALDRLSIFSRQDEQFAFKRALSRLLEMIN